MQTRSRRLALPPLPCSPSLPSSPPVPPPPPSRRPSPFAQPASPPSSLQNTPPPRTRRGVPEVDGVRATGAGKAAGDGVGGVCAREPAVVIHQLPGWDGQARARPSGFPILPGQQGRRVEQPEPGEGRGTRENEFGHRLSVAMTAGDAGRSLACQQGRAPAGWPPTGQPGGRPLQ